jgi:hypothetical protein
MKACTPTIRKGLDKDDPKAYQRFKEINKLGLTVETKFSRRDVGKDGTPVKGLRVQFLHGKFELPDLRYEEGNAKQKEQIERTLRNRLQPLTFKEAERMMRYLVDNESGQLNLAYQIDPSDLYWKEVGLLVPQKVPDKLVAADHVKGAAITAASDAVVQHEVAKIEKKKPGKPPKMMDTRSTL